MSVASLLVSRAVIDGRTRHRSLSFCLNTRACAHPLRSWALATTGLLREGLFFERRAKVNAFEDEYTVYGCSVCVWCGPESLNSRVRPLFITLCAPENLELGCQQKEVTSNRTLSKKNEILEDTCTHVHCGYTVALTYHSTCLIQDPRVCRERSAAQVLREAKKIPPFVCRSQPHGHRGGGPRVQWSA